jgi:hypothetical protein
MGKSKGSSTAHTRAYSPKAARRQEANTKRRGELAELAFQYKAASLGFGVAKPYGDSERYDFILDSRNLDSRNLDSRNLDSRNPDCPEQDSPELEPDGGKLWRVQVKSTTTLLNGLYRINAHRRVNGRVLPYRPSEVDFLVAYVFQEDAWFIFPIRDILDRTSLLLTPRKWPRPGINDHFREAWHLFRPETTRVGTAASAVPPGEARPKPLATDQDQTIAIYHLRICIWLAQHASTTKEGFE